MANEKESSRPQRHLQQLYIIAREQAYDSTIGSLRLDLLILYSTQLTNRMAVICHVTVQAKTLYGRWLIGSFLQPAICIAPTRTELNFNLRGLGRAVALRRLQN
jgi:hypothetical protein